MASLIKDFFLKKFSQLKNNKIKLWKKTMLSSITLFLLAILFLFWNFFYRQPKIITNNDITLEKKSAEISEPVNYFCPDCVRRQLDGVFVKQELSNLPPIAIMIDNHPSARPQIGLEKASLIYEAEVEGNYTRYMAVYASNEDISQIGPIRSARGYFVDWAGELDAVYAHCGGSPEALVKIVQKKIIDLNEFHSRQYFWRNTDREAPYNVITSAANLKKSLENNKILSGNYSAWKFKEDKPLPEPKNKEIIINFNHKDFKIKWVYNSEDNDYLRYSKEKPQITADNNVINAKNVIIQYIPNKVVDDKLRLKMETIGTGKAIICLDGECQEGKWGKNNFSSRTKFYYNNNNEIEFNAGQTWVEVVKPEIEIIY